MKIWKRALLAAMTLSATVATVSHAQESHFIQCDSGPSNEVNSKKKLLKAYTADFWKTVQAQTKSYPKELLRQGIVVGDFHFGNVGVYFDSSIHSARLTVNDLDDSGTNLLIGDLLKYLVYLRAIDKKGLELDQVIDAYSKGLKGQLRKMPSDLEDVLHSKSYDFEKKKAKYFEKRLEEAREFNESKITQEQKDDFAALEKLPLFNQLTNVMKLIQVNDSGSSAGMDRYLFLATSKQFGTEGLLEFKTLRCSATESQKKQDLAAINDKVVKYALNLTGESANSSLLGRQRVIWVNNRFFLYREKLPNMLNKIGIEGLDSKDLQKYAEFYASYLGFFHSKSADASYQDGIQKHKDFLLDQLKPLYRNFKERTENEN